MARNRLLRVSVDALPAMALLASSALPGCDESGPRVYTAMAYDADAACLEDFGPIGLVQSVDLPATCDPVCLTVAGTLYVSPVCAPYPAEATPVDPGSSADCASALADYTAGTSCASAPAPDAGPDSSDDSSEAAAEGAEGGD